mgnify:CR=1 FL=1
MADTPITDPIAELTHGVDSAVQAVHAHAEPTITEKFAEAQVWIQGHLFDTTSWHLPFGVNIPLSKYFPLHAMMIIVAGVILITLFCVLYKKNAKVPTGLTNFLEVFILFVRDDIAVPAMGEKDGKKMTPLLCTFFFLILALNLMGLVPLFSTATANIFVTAGLATITMTVMIGGALIKNGPGGLLGAFIPHGVPKVVLLLLTPLEMVGVVVKIFALTVRLFANLIAGHIIVLTLLSLVAVFGWVGLPALAMALMIDLIEVLVAFLQAYIFTLLSALFISQIHHPDH